MIIKNFSQLATTPLRKKALLILEEGLKASQIPNLMKDSVKKTGNYLIVKNKRFDLKKYKQIFVIGGGKASSSMAYELEKLLGKKITAGLVNDAVRSKNKIIKTNVANHPIPDKKGVAGVKKMLTLTKDVTKNDLVICIISGGGSALMPSPVRCLTLKDLQKTNDLLIRSGAAINEINMIRKHVSGFKGGQLAKHLYPATVLTLIVSDVVGDKLDVIASGPTVGDSSTYKKAISVLKKYKITKKVPNKVLYHLESGNKRKIDETPKPRSKYFRNVHHFIIGNNKPSLEAMRKKALALGFTAKILSKNVTGEAALFGKRFVKKAKKNMVIIAGGETTVTVSGKGKGGRCQEMCLNTLPLIKSETVLIAAQSDGRDHSDAAGAIIDYSSLQKVKKLDIKKFIKNNNSYAFFSKIKDQIKTGPTGTNVMDFYLVIKK